MLSQEKTDRQKVLEWLKSIGEDDPKCISDVIELCSKDLEARRYFVNRYEQDSK